VRYLTGHYEEVMRDLTLDLIGDEPDLLPSNMVRKAAVTVTWGLPLLLVLLTALAWALRLAPGRLGRALLLVSPAIILGALPALLGEPVPEYLYGWLSALALACLLTVGLALDAVLARLASGERLRSILSLPFSDRRRMILVAAATVIVLGVGAWGYSLHREAVRWSDQNGGVHARPDVHP
jgi:hypothetical protein